MFSVLPSPAADILTEDKLERFCIHLFCINLYGQARPVCGLKLVDIREQNTAIKISWVKIWIAVF